MSDDSDVAQGFRTATDPRAQDELRAAIGDGLRGSGMMPS